MAATGFGIFIVFELTDRDGDNEDGRGRLPRHPQGYRRQPCELLRFPTHLPRS